MRDPSAAERRGRAGRSFALDELTEGRAIDRFEALHRRLAAPSPA